MGSCICGFVFCSINHRCRRFCRSASELLHILQSDDFGLRFRSFNWIVIRCVLCLHFGCAYVPGCRYFSVYIHILWNTFVKQPRETIPRHFRLTTRFSMCKTFAVAFRVNSKCINFQADLLLRITHEYDDKTNTFHNQHDARLYSEYFVKTLYCREDCWMTHLSVI